MAGQFELISELTPKGDQPGAIEQVAEGVLSGLGRQTLLGVTGSGKTFTMAHVIARAQRPTLVIVHNKTLAAQLCGEFREFFPNNAVAYFVSYYDYYQPEAYLPRPTPTSRRTLPSTRRSTGCDTSPRRRCSSGGTSSLLPAYRASTPSAARRSTNA